VEGFRSRLMSGLWFIEADWMVEAISSGSESAMVVDRELLCVLGR